MYLLRMWNSPMFLLKCVEIWNIFLLFITLFNLIQCNSNILKVTEGEPARLDFPYPCDSTEVTLQHGYGLPFYRSANPKHISLSPNQYLKNDTQFGNINQCFLNLTINPVLRTDEGTYILTPYRNGQMLAEYPRIGLRVDYPPCKASCEISKGYTDGWVLLQCTAKEGAVSGTIMCYQNGKILSKNEPIKQDGIISQSIHAELNDFVLCCFFTWNQTKDKCECKDWGWDPIENSVHVSIIDPCPEAQSTQSPTTQIDFIGDIKTSSKSLTAITQDHPQQKNHSNKIYVPVIVISILVIIALSVAYGLQAKQLKRHTCNYTGVESNNEGSEPISTSSV